jgi:hypothetical protein
VRRLLRWLTATATPNLGGSGGIDVVPVLAELGIKGCAACNDREIPTAWKLRIGWRADGAFGARGYRCNVEVYFCADCLDELGDVIATAESSSSAARGVSPACRPDGMVSEGS